MSETVLTNARIVTPTEIVPGTVRLRKGRIVDVDTGPTSVSGAEDLDGDYLIPGLVELHTDNLERHVMPRPKVKWPGLPAVVSHDAEIAAAGITTVFDALRIGEIKDDDDGISRHVEELMEAVDNAADRDLLRADHFYHLRCEVCCETTADDFETFSHHERLRLVSIMDHTPGQRQFTDVEKYKIYYGGKYGLQGDALERFMALRRRDQELHSERNRRAIVARARDKGYALASHDDATDAHVAEAVEDGMVIAEFPTTVDAAHASRGHGLHVLMGAPNVVRGGSHSGNVAAIDLAERGLLDILSSDYVPNSLVQSAFMVADSVPDIDLSQAVATVSRNPARAVGLDDRGEIAPGQRADLVRVRYRDHAPVVLTVWRQGRRVV